VNGLLEGRQRVQTFVNANSACWWASDGHWLAKKVATERLTNFLVKQIVLFHQLVRQ